MDNTLFNHSVKVPKLYKCAAKISQEVAGGGGSIKQLVYEKKHFNTKALYALVVTTFQKSKQIDLLLKRTKLFEKEPRLDPWLAKILISEILWGKKQLPNSDAKPIQTILAYEQSFHAHLSDSSEDTSSEKNGNPRKKPRYVRINTLITTFNEALELFQDEGWILPTPNNENDYGSFLGHVADLSGDFMLRDLHIPDLLIFPSGTEFYNHPGYKKGAIVLQDKASCIPVHILSPPPGSVVLDMCAAPGMKTTQLAASLQNNGTVYAVERDARRFEVLNKIVDSSGATCIKTINKDVLACNNSDFPDVEYILVDPSCSASGMTDRVEVEPDENRLRLQKLAGFQIKILRSALTRYPKVKRVVYSTCSVYPEENEDVVRQVLETNNQFKLVPTDTFINKAWINFGSPDFGDIGKYCLYARPEEDLTNGFFVAVLERLEEGENNQFFNGRILNYRKNIEQKQARKERKFQERVDNFDETEGKVKDNEKLSNTVSITDVNKTEVDGNENDGDYCMENKNISGKHARKRDLKESLKKKKNKEWEHSAVEENQDLANEVMAKDLESEIINESLNKVKKKKRKDNEGANITETEEPIQSLEDENVNQTLRKSKKKKYTQYEDENAGQNNNENKELIVDKVKKKKRKHREFVLDSEEANEVNDKETNDARRKDAKNNLVNEKIDASLKKSNKKNQEDMEEVDHLISFENCQDMAEIGSSKKSKKKKETRADNGSITQTKEDQTYDDSLIKSKKKKRKHSTVDNAT